MSAPGARPRLDRLLVERGLAESRSRARALIEAGLVLVDGAVCLRPSEPLAADAVLEVTGRDHPWVSRGGVKLAAALAAFAIAVEGRICLDLGASTGGFTEVLLSEGARRVYAVDVGHGQLAAKLRDDPRVAVLERTHARDLSRRMVPEAIDLLVADLSFISLTKALPPALELVADGGRLVGLVKPQFELEPGLIGKRGIVREAQAQAEALRRVVDWLARQPGWAPRGTLDSPIAGPDGNREFLLAAEKGAAAAG